MRQNTLSTLSTLSTLPKKQQQNKEPYQIQSFDTWCQQNNLWLFILCPLNRLLNKGFESKIIDNPYWHLTPNPPVSKMQLDESRFSLKPKKIPTQITKLSDARPDLYWIFEILGYSDFIIPIIIAGDESTLILHDFYTNKYAKIQQARIQKNMELVCDILFQYYKVNQIQYNTYLFDDLSQAPLEIRVNRTQVQNRLKDVLIRHQEILSHASKAMAPLPVSGSMLQNMLTPAANNNRKAVLSDLQTKKQQYDGYQPQSISEERKLKYLETEFEREEQDIENEFRRNLELKKLEEAKRMEQLKKIEEAKIMEQKKRIEEAKRLDQKKRIEEEEEQKRKQKQQQQQQQQQSKSLLMGGVSNSSLSSLRPTEAMKKKTDIFYTTTDIGSTNTRNNTKLVALNDDENEEETEGNAETKNPQKTEPQQSNYKSSSSSRDQNNSIRQMQPDQPSNKNPKSMNTGDTIQNSSTYRSSIYDNTETYSGGNYDNRSRYPFQQTNDYIEREDQSYMNNSLKRLTTHDRNLNSFSPLRDNSSYRGSLYQQDEIVDHNRGYNTSDIFNQNHRGREAQNAGGRSYRDQSEKTISPNKSSREVGRGNMTQGEVFRQHYQNSDNGNSSAYVQNLTTRSISQNARPGNTGGQFRDQGASNNFTSDYSSGQNYKLPGNRHI